MVSHIRLGFSIYVLNKFLILINMNESTENLLTVGVTLEKNASG